MSTLTVGFQPAHPWDRTFFLAFVAACWLGVVMGFGPAMASRAKGGADYAAPLILHIHAAAFMGWMALLTAQVLLVRQGRRPTHRRLGQVAFGLIPLMVVSAIVSEVYSQRFYVDRDPENLRFFVIPLFYVAAFALLAGAAVARRGDSPSHKRLILLATTVIVGAAYARVWGADLETVFDAGLVGTFVSTFFAADTILVAAVGYDYATRCRVHPTYLVAVPILLLSQVCVALVYHSDWWPPLARTLIGR